MPLPQAAVTLVGHGKDVRRQLPHLVLAVQVHCGAVIQARYLLVGIHCRQDRTDVGLRGMKKTRGRKRRVKEKRGSHRLSKKMSEYTWDERKMILHLNWKLLYILRHTESLHEICSTTTSNSSVDSPSFLSPSSYTLPGLSNTLNMLHMA